MILEKLHCHSAKIGNNENIEYHLSFLLNDLH